MVSKSQFWPIASLRLVCVWICVFVSYFLLPVIWLGFLWFLTIDFDFQSSSAPEFSFCVCPVFVIPRYIAAITITPTTNTNTHKTIVYFDTSKSWWGENTFQHLWIRRCMNWVVFYCTRETLWVLELFPRVALNAAAASVGLPVNKLAKLRRRTCWVHFAKIHFG